MMPLTSDRSAVMATWLMAIESLPFGSMTIALIIDGR